jgi:hypothetical protein
MMPPDDGIVPIILPEPVPLGIGGIEHDLLDAKGIDDLRHDSASTGQDEGSSRQADNRLLRLQFAIIVVHERKANLRRQKGHLVRGCHGRNDKNYRRGVGRIEY